VSEREREGLDLSADKAFLSERDENIRNIFAVSRKAISYVYLYGNLEVDI
jgi:hypothetical protein